MPVTRFYKAVLGLYPADFYNEFADEMLDTFLFKLEDRQKAGQSSKLIIVSEVVDTVFGAVIQRGQSAKQTYSDMPLKQQELLQARWIVRLASLLYVLFMVFVSMESFITKPSTESLLMPVLFGLHLPGVLLAFIWERNGGIVLLTSTVTLGLISYVGYASVIPELGFFGLFMACLWVIPFGAFALAYIHLGRRKQIFSQHMLKRA